MSNNPTEFERQLIKAERAIIRLREVGQSAAANRLEVDLKPVYEQHEGHTKLKTEEKMKKVLQVRDQAWNLMPKPHRGKVA